MFTARALYPLICAPPRVSRGTREVFVYYTLDGAALHFCFARPLPLLVASQRDHGPPPRALAALLQLLRSDRTLYLAWSGTPPANTSYP